MNLLNRLFIIQTWELGYAFSKIQSLKDLQKANFNIIKSSKKEWYADPFCVSTNGNFYIFCEVFDTQKGKGSIGVFDYRKDSFKKCSIIIEEPYHMSYPYVFHYKNEWLMIPEMCESNELRIYKADDFPYKWTLKKKLLSSIKYVDSTIYSNNNDAYLFCYDISDDIAVLKQYSIDLDSLSITLLDSMVDSSKELRPAGFIKNDIFVSQYNKNYYGEGLIFNKIPFFNKKVIERKTVFVDELSIANRRYHGIHTINSEEDIAVIDLLKRRFCIYKPFLILSRRRK